MTSIPETLRSLQVFQTAFWYYICSTNSKKEPRWERWFLPQTLHMGGAIKPGHWGSLAGGKHGEESVGFTTPVSQTSDCDRGGLLKHWVVEANSQMSHWGFLPLLPEGRTLDCDSGGQTPPTQPSPIKNIHSNTKPQFLLTYIITSSILFISSYFLQCKSTGVPFKTPETSLTATVTPKCLERTG